MTIDDLASVIETLQQRIRQHGPALRENEIRTRIALIDPLLRALGIMMRLLMLTRTGCVPAACVGGF